MILRARLLEIAVFVAVCGGTASAKVIDKDTSISGITVHYRVVLPTGYDPARTYPAILAFPPGSQTMDMVMSTLQRNWAGEAQRRGYIVVIPAAPLQGLFMEEGARVFPAFLDQWPAENKIRDRKFHIAGISNGGISAFHIAASWPQYFWSVTVFPGFLPDASPERVGALAKMCINMQGVGHRLAEEHAGAGVAVSYQGIHGSNDCGEGREPRDRDVNRRGVGAALRGDRGRASGLFKGHSIKEAV